MRARLMVHFEPSRTLNPSKARSQLDMDRVMVAKDVPVDPYGLVVFGATGDFARLKPIALSDMAQRYQSGDLRQQVL